MKRIIVIICTVSIVMCMCVVHPQAATSTFYFQPDTVVDTGGYVSPTITTSMSKAWFGSDFTYNFTPTCYIQYTLVYDSSYTTTQRTYFEIEYQNLLSGLSSNDIVEVNMSFASFVSPLYTELEIVDSLGTYKKASFELVTTENSFSGSTAQTYNFTALITDFDDLVAPYSFYLLIDVPYVFVSKTEAGATSYFAGYCYIPMTDLAVTIDTSDDDTSGDDSSSDMSSDDTSSGGFSGETSSGGSSGGGSSGDTSTDDSSSTEERIISKLDDIYSKIVSTNSTIVSINSALTNVTPELQVQLDKLQELVNEDTDRAGELEDEMSKIDPDMRDDVSNMANTLTSAADELGAMGETTYNSFVNDVFGHWFFVAVFSCFGALAFFSRAVFG